MFHYATNSVIELLNILQTIEKAVPLTPTRRSAPRPSLGFAPRSPIIGTLPSLVISPGGGWRRAILEARTATAAASS